MRYGHNPPLHFLVQPVGPRPDFRLLLDFLWPPETCTDTDGDSHNPASREWTFLLCGGPGTYFEVEPVHEEPFTWGIRSYDIDVEARVAYFLASETGSLIIDMDTAERHPPAWLVEFMGHFDLPAATARAARSRWRRSTLEDPYPADEP